MPQVSIVIPAYNETENFSVGALDKVFTYLQKKNLDWEVIVVDDGSTDSSPLNIADYIKNKPSWRLIKNPHQGKATTVATGVKNAQSQLVLFTDFDQATPISEIEKLLPFMSKGYSIAIGSREVKGARRLREPWYRHLMGRVFNLFVSLLAIRGIQDTQCGFKLFKTAVARNLFDRLVVYAPKKETTAFTGAFDVELLYLAQKLRLKIAEVPVHWKHVHTTRVNPLKDSIRMFLDLLRIRLADFSGRYSKENVLPDAPQSH